MPLGHTWVNETQTYGAGPIKTIDTLQNGHTLKYGNFEFTVVALDQTGAYIKVKQ